MKLVSDDFKAAASAPVKQVNATLIIDPYGEPITVTDKDKLISFSIESTGSLFGSVASTATIKLLGSDYDILGKPVRIMFGLLTDRENDVYKTIDYGIFYITEAPVKKGAETTTVKAVDKMGMLQTTDYEANIDYPLTVEELAGKIADNFDLTIGDMTTLPNHNYSIKEDLYSTISGANYRNILEEIAGATASMVSIDGVTQEIIFRPPQEAVQGELDYETMKSLTLGSHYGPVNSVVLARVPQEDNIAVIDEDSIEANGLTEVKLANNEIMDDERELFAQPILDVVDGLEWTGFEATTVGHGWYECGDRITFTDAEGVVWEGVVTYHKITIDGGVKEEVKGIVPDETTTNYALAGGIAKTIYNTEIKVDKQNQRIESVVEEQSSFEDQTNANFSNVTQDIQSVITSIQNSGGNNLIKNSAFYAINSENIPLYWQLSEGGSWAAIPSVDASANGSLSGQVIQLKGKSITQVIVVKADNDNISEATKTYYSFSCRIKKTAVGTASITLSDGTEGGVWSIDLGNNETADYSEFAIEGILPHSTQLTLRVEASDDTGIEFYITDMMLAVGNMRSQWTQANGEFSNSQVQIDIDGITVKNNNLDGSYTKLTPQALEVYKDNRLAAIVSNERISAATGEFEDEIDMPPLKIVSQTDGWAFVRKER